ncbi:prolipoprotein diacylglyceryl transferase [Pedococcus bigeumensis]|uniref:Phosphatidylglycerol--prolipoprotein diacylglyceryl transferase n=1 Tax=Pedococcus bigeumensis TaxID=433644 RepID=A0A502CZV3_9MICO|nr:prolipoprotein diacylglyceryl transferase [Pedococcus bigeumensis]TPG17366.1 prolipoprotein diacylglyceryl transferase [Pedococcus bigeumensis]
MPTPDLANHTRLDLARLPLSIPSPSQGVWHLGPVPIRAYALCILAGIAVAVLITDRRWRARGGPPGVVLDIAGWAVPFGIAGGRLYHVLTDPELYFQPGRDPWNALKIWQGGLGIWGAVALGALGAWIGARRAGVSVAMFADAAAPGIAIAQAFGRWGNWFNQELFGAPTTLPWGLHIDAAHRPPGYQQYATFQPTFLYESLWCLGVAGLVLWADRRFSLTRGRAFALYVATYTAGRAWIEYLRIDTANHILGLRLNDWTSLLIFISATAYFLGARPRKGDPLHAPPGPDIDSSCP